MTVEDLYELINQLSTPRRIVLSVPSGLIVDIICQDLMAADLEPADVVVDTGNSQWRDSIARGQKLDRCLSEFTITPVKRRTLSLITLMLNSPLFFQNGFYNLFLRRLLSPPLMITFS